MNPATASADKRYFFEFALRARKIAILGALVTQFYEMSGLAPSG